MGWWSLTRSPTADTSFITPELVSQWTTATVEYFTPELSWSLIWTLLLDWSIVKVYTHLFQIHWKDLRWCDHITFYSCNLTHLDHSFAISSIGYDKDSSSLSWWCCLQHSLNCIGSTPLQDNCSPAIFRDSSNIQETFSYVCNCLENLCLS